MNRSARGAKSVKHFERSSELDTALYENYLCFTMHMTLTMNRLISKIVLELGCTKLHRDM